MNSNPHLAPLRVSAFVLLLLASGCKEATADANTPTVDAGEYDPCSEERTKRMKPFMECFVAPFGSMDRGDEASFRVALEELRGMVPDARYAQEGDPNNWITIVDRMLETRQYKAGCKRCHNAWRTDYKRRFSEVLVR